MVSYTAHILGPRGSSRRIEILADDLTHALALVRSHAARLYGCRGYSFILWPA